MTRMQMLFTGVFGTLALASLIGGSLKFAVARGRAHGVIDNLNARIRAWWWMVGLIGVAFVFDKGGVIVLFGLASFLAMREFFSMTYTRRGDHAALALCFFVVLPFQYWLLWSGWYGLYAIFIPVYAFLILPVAAVLQSDTVRFLERVSKVQWAVMICVYCLSHVPGLLMIEIPGYGGGNLLLIAFLIIVVQSSDVLQYVWGKLMGRRLVAPQLSPSKTVEGLVGGVLSATLLGAALWWITPFNPWQAGAIAFVINLMGFLGGLVMSAIKRDHGVKDWGELIEGHGGVLDRLDSVVFSAPIFFHIVRYWWEP